jgi:hypothetical protein
LTVRLIYLITKQEPQKKLGPRGIPGIGPLFLKCSPFFEIEQEQEFEGAAIVRRLRPTETNHCHFSLHLYVKRSDHVYHARHAGEDGGIGGLHELRGAGEFRKLRLEFATRIPYA